MRIKHKKKTRKEKIIADYRHQVYSFENKNTSLNMPIQTFAVNVVNKHSYSYTYILNDVLKTGLLTLSIIAAQLILFFLLKNHIIVLPNLSF